MRIALIGDADSYTLRLRKDVQAGLVSKGYDIETIDRFLPDRHPSLQLHAAFNMSDAVVVLLTKGSSNSYYEIGLAHGARKPVILVTPQDMVLPADLAGYYTVSLSEGSDTGERIIFSVCKVLESIVSEPKRKHDLIGPAGMTSALQVDIDYPKFPFRDLYAFSGPRRHDAFEQWFIRQLNNNQWLELTERSTSTRNDGFDLLIWNKSSDPDLKVLQNPIPFELKTVNFLKVIDINRLVALVKKARLGSMVIATTGKVTKDAQRRLLRAGKESESIIVVLDRDSLAAVSTPSDLVHTLKRAVRDQLYREA